MKKDKLSKSKMRKYSKQKVKKDKLSKLVSKIDKTDKKNTDIVDSTVYSVKKDLIQKFDDEKELVTEEPSQKIDRDVEEVEKEIEDNLNNIEDEQFITSQQGISLVLPLTIGGFSIPTLSLLLPVFGINSFAKFLILFAILLFFIWFTIKFYPTPDEINDRLLNELDLYQCEAMLG